jgi:molecular chaperone GrpE
MSENTSENAEKNVNDVENINNEETTETTEANDSIESLKQELLDAQTSSKESYDKLLRNQAEMDNLRKRNAKDLENAHKFALDGFAKSLLEVADSITMGIKTAGEENATLDGIKEGMEITNKVFLDTLEKNGIKQINPVNEKFDPANHEAITMVPNPDIESGSVIEVMQVGFSLNDRVLRPAMVVVAS